MDDAIANVLRVRGATYGSFADIAKISQQLKRVMRYAGGYYVNLPFANRESLDMIAHKMARVVSGNVFYVDNWIDIAGYAKLVESTLLDTVPVDMPTNILSNHMLKILKESRNYENMPSVLKMPLSAIVIALGHTLYKDPMNRYPWTIIVSNADNARVFCEKMPDEQSHNAP